MRVSALGCVAACILAAALAVIAELCEVLSQHELTASISSAREREGGTVTGPRMRIRFFPWRLRIHAACQIFGGELAAGVSVGSHGLRFEAVEVELLRIRALAKVVQRE